MSHQFPDLSPTETIRDELERQAGNEGPGSETDVTVRMVEKALGGFGPDGWMDGWMNMLHINFFFFFLQNLRKSFQSRNSESALDGELLSSLLFPCVYPYSFIGNHLFFDFLMSENLQQIVTASCLTPETPFVP